MRETTSPSMPSSVGCAKAQVRSEAPDSIAADNAGAFLIFLFVSVVNSCKINQLLWIPN